MRGSSSPSAGSTAPAAAQTFGGSPRSVRCMRSAARRSRPIATAAQPSLPWKPTHDEADTDLDPGRRVRGDHGGVAPGTFATHAHVIDKLEHADLQPDPATRRQLLTFVIAGGGFAGVETIAELNDFLRGAGRFY